MESVLGLCGRYQDNLIWDGVETAGLPQSFHCGVAYRIWGFLGRQRGLKMFIEASMT